MTAEPVATDRVLATLKSTFGYSSFRPLQEEIVRSVLAGQDAFVLMPTGGGKSLCYQLPALLRDGLTVVVSPLIALMKDQVDALRELGVAATYINSLLDSSQISARQAAVTRGEVKLLYVAPERLVLPGFLRLLASVRLDFFAIDEAHCISEWGHDFRPEYRDLSRLRTLFPNTPLGAFTATATPRVEADIKTQLGLNQAASFHGSYNRANLFYEVRPKRRTYDHLVAYLRVHPGASGIIYCQSRAGTEELASRLQRDDFRAAAYHAGLPSEERRRRQEAFIKDDVPIIVATIAFGMGIDKPDVRFVIHYDLPKSLEGYYQESGRAGRDGEPSDCILFYSAGDLMKQKRFIAEKPSAQERRIAEWQLQRMADWAESASCRRRALLTYFEAAFDGQNEPCCDICRTGAKEEDFTIPAQMFLSCVVRTGERFGATHVIQVLRGSRAERVTSFGHDRLSTYGIGKERSEDEWHHIARELIRAGYLRQDPQAFNGLKVTERGRAVLFQGERVMLAAPVAAEVDSASAPERVNPELFERLRDLRKQLADERRLAPYMIFHDSVLHHLAAALPETRAQLLTVPGVGERKAEDYGGAFLEAIAAYVGETGATPQPLTAAFAPVRRTKGSMGDSASYSLKLFLEGHDLEAIAAMRGFTPSTIGEHLAHAIEAGEPVPIERLISADRRKAIEDAMRLLGPDYLGPLKEHLGEAYSYAELRIVRAAVKAAAEA